MTSEERWGLYRCVEALLSRVPTPQEWGRFVETFYWLEFDNGKPEPSDEEWRNWLRYLDGQEGLRKREGKKE